MIFKTSPTLHQHFSKDYILKSEAVIPLPHGVTVAKDFLGCGHLTQDSLCSAGDVRQSRNTNNWWWFPSTW